MKRLTPLLIPLLLSACSESGVKAYNVDPVAEIISHADGAEVLEGYVETFRGAVSDANHGASNLTATWYLDGDVLCEGAAPDAVSYGALIKAHVRAGNLDDARVALDEAASAGLRRAEA